MNKILFLFPSEETYHYARSILERHFPEALLDHVAPVDSPALVEDYAAQGVGIVAARGGVAHVLREARMNITLVDIPVTAFEIIKAINNAKQHGKNFAVLAHAQMTVGIDFLASVTGGNVRHYEVRYNQNYEKAVLEAVADGAEVIIGGALACAAAKQHDIPYSMLAFGMESLLQAGKEARQIREALEMEHAKRSLFGAVIESSSDGIITVNADGYISEMNNASEKLLGKSRQALAGKRFSRALPQLSPARPKPGTSGRTQSIVSLRGSKVICEAEPIRYNDKTYGTVYSLRKTSNIQKMEAMIRQDLYARGHVAVFRFSDIVGESAAIREAVAMAGDYAETNSSVLILGETGTGKEVFAQSIHNASSRADGPFVAINCAAIPTHLLESELFGYVGGAFTGASREGKPGLLEIAHGGTIFLDEMAEMDYANQGRLLRFQQERSVVRLGSYKVIPVDVRVIVATNKNLEEMVARNAFRDDLYYRLNVLRLELPPLRCRKGDIVLYAGMFLDKFAGEAGKTLRLSPGAERVLEEYPWPGNVRECRNIMERAAARVKSGLISGPVMRDILGPSCVIPPSSAPPIPTRPQRQREEIARALAEAAGNYGEAAAILGVNRSTLYRRMKRLGITY